ncbi:hypothetical protein GUJ93_ZPchr0003g18650 [Zizania palustris]|uniref:Uncharacterized protein n=1 Tax=Zizania palustris TaxID=103762 RepID=A0A8J5RX69_ZIZPA|nr:hypothetical protein GUJ93_ZPchr0003g18650 [Zizania palustris]
MGAAVHGWNNWWCSSRTCIMVLKLLGTHRQSQKRGRSPPPRGRTTSLYRPGVVQDDYMAVPPARRRAYLGGDTSSSSSTPAWDLAMPSTGGRGEGVGGAGGTGSADHLRLPLRWRRQRPEAHPLQ